MTSKKRQELAQQQTQELTARIETLANDVNHVLDMPNFDLHVERGHRSYMIEMLAKESLVRKYAKWLEQNGGHASIVVLTYNNRRRVMYRYSTTADYTPLPPATRFDRECKCWHCGKPVPAWWRCRERGCNAYTCDACGSLANSSRCPLHAGISDHKTPDYKPTAPHRFTVGLEIETERRLPDMTRKAMCTSPLIAGWSHDVSLPDHALEYQTQPLTIFDMPGLINLVRRLPECKLGKAGGHMHVSRTPRQTCGRWWHALAALNKRQARALNMRHTDESRWCKLRDGYYHGKSTAVNGDHEATIELRTFGHWDKSTVDKLAPAVEWVHAMWRMFEQVPKGHLRTETILKYAYQTATRLTTHPKPLETRLDEYKAARKKERDTLREEQRKHVVRNIEASKRARMSHGGDLDRRLWAQRMSVKERTRERIRNCYNDAYLCFVWPNDKHAAAIIVRNAIRFGEVPQVMGNKVTGGEMDVPPMGRRVAVNILRTRRARASHGKNPSYTRGQLFRILAKRAGMRVNKAGDYGLYTLTKA